MDGYGQLNFDVKTHSKLHEKVKKVLETDEPKPTNKILEEIVPHEGWDKGREDWTHTRTILGYLRQYMEDQGEIEVHREYRGGQPTYMWKKVEE